MKKRPVIAVDIDDVLARSAEGFADFSNQQWGAGMTADDYTEEWAVAWNVPLEEALKRADVIHAAGAFGRFRQFDAASPVLRRLHEQNDLIVITSRRQTLKPETDVWLERHFAGLFSGIHYMG